MPDLGRIAVGFPTTLCCVGSTLCSVCYPACLFYTPRLKYFIQKVYDMEEEETTLRVPKDFAEHLRNDVDGHNDYKRLQNWKNNDTEESYTDCINLNDIEDAVENLLNSTVITRDEELRVE